MTRWLSPGLLLLLLLAGCAPDITETDFYRMHPSPDEGAGAEVVLLDDAAGSGRLTIVSEAPLGWGFNAIRLAQMDGWRTVDPELVFETATRRWTSPVRSALDGSDGVVYAFPVPGSEGDWFLEVTGETDAGNRTVRAPVAVAEDIWIRPFGHDLVVAWVLPTTPRTGTDIMELALYRITSTGFEPVTDASLDLYPYMDMGGGEGHSTPYEAPVHVGGGQYRGMVNFIMSGGWDMTVKVTRAGQTHDVLFHAFTVE